MLKKPSIIYIEGFFILLNYSTFELINSKFRVVIRIFNS